MPQRKQRTLRQQPKAAPTAVSPENYPLSWLVCPAPYVFLHLAKPFANRLA